MGANEIDHARTLLNRIPALQQLCDLDLLVFFAKHPRTLMSNEQLARLLGYQLKEIARSLDVLLAAGFLTRTQTPNNPARIHLFATGGMNSGALPAVVEFASTREGRLELRLALTQSLAGRTDGLATQAGDDPGTVVG